jgi:hypothetical protein
LGHQQGRQLGVAHQDDHLAPIGNIYYLNRLKNFTIETPLTSRESPHEIQQKTMRHHLGVRGSI